MGFFRVPKDFQRSLRLFDPDLRARWSDVRGCFLIERRVLRGPASPVSHDPETGAVWDSEMARATMDGYDIVMEVGWNSLDSRVFAALYGSDIWRQGGAEAVSLKIDQRILDHQRRTRREFLDRVSVATRERLRYRDTVRTLTETHAHTAPPGGLSIAGN